jgi:hypothetical protein
MQNIGIIKTPICHYRRNVKMRLNSILFFALLCSTLLNAETMHVQIKVAALKNTPSFLGKTIQSLQYGESVTSIQKNGEWFEVKNASKQGWLHSSALTTKEIILSDLSKNAPENVSSNEVIMAGKGFNAQVESQYRDKNPKLRFDLVDAMEKYQITSDSQHQFVKNGKLIE